MNVLITGGSGFIGGYVYRYLKMNKYHVKNFDIIGNDQDPDFIHGSITDFDKVKRAVYDSDIIFHFAGFSNINNVKDKPLECIDLNIMGTANLLEAIRLKGEGKLIIASSVYVHQKQGHLYTTSKVAAERICEDYLTLYNIPTTIIRLGTVYGEYSRHEDVISIFVKKLSNGENICVHGDGKQKRNFIHGDDIAHACEKILINKTYGKKLILAGKKPTTINQLVSILEQINPLIQVSYSKDLAREDDYQGDIGNLKETYKLLNWRPSIGLCQGINRLKKHLCKTS